MKGKSKVLIALLAAFCMSTAVAGFTACDDGPQVNTDPHAYTDADGDKLCDDCGKIKGDSVHVFEAHTFADEDSDNVCDVCGREIGRVTDPEPSEDPGDQPETPEKKTYVVNFETNGGNTLPKQGVKEGEKAQRPEDPVKSSYTFDGWYMDDACTHLFDFDKAVDGNVTAYAKWKDAAATADTYFDFAETEGGVSIAAKAGQTLPQDVVLPSVYNNKAVVAIKSSAFEQQPAMKAVKIPSSVKSIGQYAFRNCTALETVNGGENLEEVGYGAFANTAWDLNFPVGEVYLGKTLYKYAGSLYTDTQITVKDGTVGVSAGAFEGMTHLVGITLPESVKSVGSQAFAGTGLMSVTVKAAEVPALGNNILGTEFAGRIFVPASSVSSYREAKGWKAYAEKIFAAGTAEQTFVVTFKAEGAENIPAAQNVKGFGKATSPAGTPTKAGLEFGGWYLDEACTIPFDFESEITENLNIYAKFGKYYDVTFSVGEGLTAPQKQHLEEGTYATAPEAPEKAGSEFMGWFEDEACTKKFDFTDPVSGNITVYAKYLPAGENYTGEGDYEGWVIENGRVKEYTGSLTEIKIPKELTRLTSITEIVPAPAFSTSRTGDLTKIKSITVDPENEYFEVKDGALLSKDGTVLYFQLTMANVNELKHPDVVTVAPYAFYKQALTAGNMQSALELGEVQEVGEYAFFGSKGLTNFEPFKTAKTIGEFAFYDTQFKTVESDAKTIGRCAFTVSTDNSAIETIILHNIETVASYTFGFYITNGSSGNTSGNLKTLVIGPNVKTIPRSAFGNRNLSGVCRVILESDKLIGVQPGAFNGSTTTGFRLYVKEALFEDFKKEGAFLKYNKGYYTEDGWYVDKSATTTRFTYEGSYESVKIPAGITFLNGILDIFGSAENLEQCKTFSVADGNEGFKMQDGALVSADGKTLYAYFGNGTGNFTDVTEIKPYAFYNRLKVQEAAAASENGLKFGSLETVGNYAFYGCTALTDYTPFGGLRIISKHAFEGTGLTTLTFDNTILASIEESAFANCEALSTVYVKLLTQPKIAQNVFGENVKIYVPYEYESDYMIAWALYLEQVQGDENMHVYEVTFLAGEGATEVDMQVLLSGGKAERPEDPERAGYFFDGWSVEENIFAAYNFSMPVNGNVTLYAFWSKGHTVSFETGSKASHVEDVTVRHDTLASQPEDPVWDGYVFGGWFRDRNCTLGFDFAKETVEGDITLYAKWSQGFVIDFETGKGSDVATQSVLPENTPVRPEDPTLTGYKFAGWFTKDGTNGDWGSEFKFDGTLSGNLTLFAKWTENFWDIDESGKLLNYYGPYDSIVIPAELKSLESILDIFGTLENYEFCTSIVVEGASTSFKAENSALLSYDGTVLYAFFGGGEESYAWPTVTAIADYAFKGHFGTDAELAFSEALATVGAHAFEETAISSFKPFENVKKIGEYAFVGSQLVNITWNTDGEVPSNVFTNIPSLKTITFMNAMSIGKEAFAGDNKITTITLGANVKTIGQSAFWDAGQADSIKDINMYAVTPPTLTGGGKSETHPLGGDKSYGTWKPHFTVHCYKNSLASYTSTSLTGWNWYKTSQYVAFTVNVTLHMGEAEGKVEAPAVTGYLNTTLTKPVPAAWEGKAFVGWFTDETLETEFNFKQSLKGDVELWAKWADGYAVNFSTGEGGSTVASQTVVKGGKATKPANPTKTGWFFDGWYTTETYETEFDFANATIDAATTLYAKWTQGVNVTFNLDGGSGTGTGAQSVYPGKSATKPTRNPTKTGYTFEGWYLKTEAGEFEAEAFDFSSVIEKDVEIFAKWTKNMSVTFDLDSGTGTGTSAQSVYPGKTATKPTKDPTKTGYFFDGWFLKDEEGNFLDTQFDFGSAIEADTVIYAKWTQGIDVTFSTGDGASAVTKQNIRPGTSATKPAKDPTKTGYFFEGWFTQDGTETSEWGDEFDFKSTIDEATTVYAKWTQGIDVTFSTGDGSKVNAQNVYPGKTASKPADPTLSGYFFDGWYKNEDCTETFDFQTAISEATTIYAKWTQGVTVSYSTGESGYEVKDELVYPGKNATKPEATPTWVGHLFEGWFTQDGTETGEWGEEFKFGETPINEATTVYAKWSDGLTVTFSVGDIGAAEVPTQTLKSGETATRPATDPAVQGYLFLGWYTKDGTEGDWGSKFDFRSTITESTTVYARWLENFWDIDADGKLLHYYGPTDSLITIPASVKSISSILDIYGTKDKFAAGEGIALAPLNKAFKYQNHALLNAEGTVLYAYFGGAETLEWPNVVEIGDYAFYKKITAEKTLTFSAELAKVGKGAFEGCTGLTSFEPFEDVENIGADAFNNTSLVEVVWNVHGATTAAFKNITTLKKVVFMNATSIAASICSGSKNITDIVIGPNVTTIGASAFYSAGSNKKIESITVYALKPPTLSNASGSTHPLGGDPAKKTFYVYVPNSVLSAYTATNLTGWNWYNQSSGRNSFKPITVNVTMHMGEGDGVPQAPAVNGYWGDKLAAPIPENWKGHVFEGWYTDATFARRFNFNAQLTDDIELYAKWVDGLYVEFDCKGGTDIDWIPVLSGEKVEKPEDPYLLGSEFVGWFTKDGSNDDWGTEFNFDAPITENVKLYAKWNKGYAVQFDLGYSGAKAIEGQTIMPTDADRHVKKPTDPTRTNWTFEGWWTKNGENGDWGTQFDFEETEIAEDTMLYAKWNPWVVNADGSLKTYSGDKKNIEIPLNVKSMTDITKIFGSYSSVPVDFSDVTFKVAAGHEAFKIEKNMLLDIEGKICYLYMGTATTVDLSGITEVKGSAFANRKDITEITTPDLVTVGTYAFYHNDKLAKADFTKITTIGDYGFYGCAFETLTLDATETIGGSAFYLCQDLTSVTLNAVKTIGSSAFSDDIKLATVVIGENCTSIGNNAFNRCTALLKEGGSITVKATKVPTLGGTSVFGTASSFKGTIYVPAASLSAYQAASRWSNLKAQISAITE